MAEVAGVQAAFVVATAVGMAGLLGVRRAADRSGVEPHGPPA
jgi:hypothetical protein